MKDLKLARCLAVLCVSASMFVSFGGSAAAAGATLRIGSDISYAPLEFFSKGDPKPRGFDMDLARALGARLGRPVQILDRSFDSLLGDVADGKIDLAISAVSDTRAREKKVSFIDYFLAGSGMLVPAGNRHHIFSLAALCGLSVDVQFATSQAIALQTQSVACKAVGLAPILLQQRATDDAALSLLLSGKSDVHVTDFPVVAYLARTLDGGKRFVVAGRQFDVVPYGIAVAKNNVALADAVQAALQSLIADGTYDRLLAKWGLGQGALRSTPIDAGTLYQH
ncbi:MAG: ABC transporter substrate-binding protein [Candidatus Eremiobacteraeota bacterium]|nr:ABC transporter substrate-binding protein [Candidatus Eremiobacteraeota bacterium]NNM93704.1 ABC transporter substrate-binding protein [Candidatus Eremiobacteraeota bacterium]